MDEAAQTLVKRGFATRIVIRQHKTTLDLTPTGRALVGHLHHLFAIRHRSLDTISRDEVAAVIGLLLAIPPAEKPH